MGDTIVIETPVATVLEVTGLQGPQGVPGASQADVLTVQGDLLYRGASEAARLPIGTSGQVLKVSGGVPAWANESGGVPASRTISAGAGLTGGGDLSANRTLAVSFGSSAGTACEGNDSRLSDSRTPTAHAASHAAAGSDPLAPSDIGAQSIFTSETITLSGDTTLSAARAKIWTVNSFSTNTRTITLPTSAVSGDVAIVRALTILGNVEIVSGSTLATMQTGAIQQNYRFVYTSSWALDPITTHGHFASQIISGTLAHERGGLEADVSAYSGLVKISGGSTSAVTVTAAGEALLDDADAAAQRTTLGLGTAATAATGDFAAASHNHELTALAATGATNGHVLTANGSNGVTFAALPASGVTSVSGTAPIVSSGGTTPAISIQNSPTLTGDVTINGASTGVPGSLKVGSTTGSFNRDVEIGGNGIVLRNIGGSGTTTISLGQGSTSSYTLTPPAASGTIALTSNTVSSVASSASDVLGVSGANITGVDANADRLVFWDDSASKLTYLEAGSGLSISGTTLTASGGLNAMQSIAINFVLN